MNVSMNNFTNQNSHVPAKMKNGVLEYNFSKKDTTAEQITLKNKNPYQKDCGFVSVNDFTNQNPYVPAKMKNGELVYGEYSQKQGKSLLERIRNCTTSCFGG